MKRIFAWILVLQFASGHNLVTELARMSSLIEHYKTHRQETPDLSFAHFLWLHYLETSHTHSDNSHARLPLHCSHNFIAESLLPQAPEVTTCVPAITVSGYPTLPVFDESFSPNDYSFGLLRPPIA